MWKDIPGCEGVYQASNEGQIRSVNRVIKSISGQTYERAGVVLSPYIHKSGHLYVNIRTIKKTTSQVHRLVLLTFVGACPEGQEVRHIDGNPQNNRLSNLAYGTRKENITDTLSHGTRARGEIHGMSKLTEADILEMFAMKHRGAKYSDIASHFNVAKSMVSNLFAGRAWRWLTEREQLL